MIVRDAASSDVEGIMHIYNDAVLNTTAIWNDTQVDAENRIKWLNDRLALGYPVLVADEGGKVVGYASFGDWRPFDGYRYTVEHSIYVASECRGAGIGKALLAELVERARRLGKHVMVAGIESGNQASIALHKRLGFEHAGVVSEVGTKFGRWLDLAFMQLKLDEAVPNDGK